MSAGVVTKPTVATEGAGPERASLVLGALILSAFVCNINLSVANIALPDIGKAFGASQTAMNLVAVACTLGLAMSVLYFGALGDRYGRKQILLLGLMLTVPMSIVAAYAPSTEVLVVARLGTGLAAGMAYPTTLALITALWPQGAKRTKAIALWSGISAGSAALGPVLAGFLLAHFWWGSVFFIAVPPALIAVVLVVASVPSHVSESTASVDHPGGVLSFVMIGTLIFAISFVGAPGHLRTSLILFAATIVLGTAFVVRQRRASNPIYDLDVAQRRTFWVPAIAGMVVFGSLIGAMFIGQQFLQNVLGYSTVTAGVAILPSAIGLVCVAPLSAKLVMTRGARSTMLLGYAFCFASFLVMLLCWRQGVGYWAIGLGYLLMGVGGGLALTPASRSITGSTPVVRVGMASGTCDLQRDLGGSIMQALLGSFLTFGYANAFARQLGQAPSATTTEISQSTEMALQASYSSAAKTAARFPQYSNEIIAAARTSFESGSRLAYSAGLLAIAAGAILVRTCFPGHVDEEQLLEQYASENG